ncbi:MAG: hypothetical protein WA484_03895 [Solirubrobacteraceae bacterium]
MTAKPPLRDAEVARILGLLEPLSDDRSIVLVGGQAVTFWTRFLGERSSEVGALTPMASKDIDFEGSARAVRRAADLLRARMRLASMDDHTPNTGIVLFVDADGIEREIDFIDQPLGLQARDVRDTAVRLLIPTDEPGGEVGVWVMHPERCMESRIYNAQVLGKTDVLAVRQLQASIVCAREWSRYLLDDDPSPERVRAVLRINERIFRKCINDLHFRKVEADVDVDPFQAVLAEHEALPARFRDTRYPQMRRRLEEKRSRASDLRT